MSKHSWRRTDVQILLGDTIVSLGVARALLERVNVDQRQALVDSYTRGVSSSVSSWVPLTPCLLFCPSPTGHLYVIGGDRVTGDVYEFNLLDVVRYAELDLTTDPRRVPARIGDILFTAVQNPAWDLFLLLCAFDTIHTAFDPEATEYTLWDAVQVSVTFSPKENTVLVTGVVHPPIYYVEGLLL